ncbi:MAG TPA: hypothetical protein VGG33_27835 [Polyangia bacterium]
MVTTFLLMAMILAVGTRAADSMRVRQEEVILRKLSVPQAAVFYDELTRRARRVRFLRAVTFTALVLTILAARRRFLAPKLMRSADTVEVAPAGPPTNTEAAKAIANRELARQGAQGVVDQRNLALREVTGDDRHPWIFEYVGRATDSGRPARVRIYVDRAGRAELHRIHD